MTSFQRVVSLLALSLAACGGEATPEPASPPPAPLEATAPATPSVGASSLDQSGTGADTGSSATSASSAAAATPPAPAPLTDEQILMVSDLANTSEVDQARVAQGKAKDAKVRKFAAMMVTHHSEAKQKQKKLVGKLKLTPAESPLATELTTDSSTMLATLKSTPAPDFDTAYIDAQVQGHTKVLDALTTRLIPSAQNAELKALLEELRPRIEAHLQEAKDLQQALAAKASSSAGAVGASQSSGASSSGAAKATGTTSGAGTGTGTGASSSSAGKGTGAGTGTGAGPGAGTGAGKGTGSGTTPGAGTGSAK